MMLKKIKFSTFLLRKHSKSRSIVSNMSTFFACWVKHIRERWKYVSLNVSQIELCGINILFRNNRPRLWLRGCGLRFRKANLR